MKRLFFALILISFVLVDCSPAAPAAPSEGGIQTAIAQTAEAMPTNTAEPTEPKPTATVKRIKLPTPTPEPTNTLEPESTSTPTSEPVLDDYLDIVLAYQDTSIEALELLKEGKEIAALEIVQELHQEAEELDVDDAFVDSHKLVVEAIESEEEFFNSLIQNDRNSAEIAFERSVSAWNSFWEWALEAENLQNANKIMSNPSVLIYAQGTHDDVTDEFKIYETCNTALTWEGNGEYDSSWIAFQIYDSDGNYVNNSGSHDTYGGSSGKARWPLEPGTYYIEVSTGSSSWSLVLECIK